MHVPGHGRWKNEHTPHEEDRKALALMIPSRLYVRGRQDEAARAKKAMKIQAALAVAVGFAAGWIARSWLDWSQFQNMFGPTL